MIKYVVYLAVLAVASSSIITPQSFDIPIKSEHLITSHTPVTTASSLNSENENKVTGSVNFVDHHPIGVESHQVTGEKSTLGTVPVFGIHSAPLTFIPVDTIHGASHIPVPVNAFPTHIHALTGTLYPISFQDPTATVPVQLGPLQDILSLLIKAIRDAIERRREEQQLNK